MLQFELEHIIIRECDLSDVWLVSLNTFNDLEQSLHISVDPELGWSDSVVERVDGIVSCGKSIRPLMSFLQDGKTATILIHEDADISGFQLRLDSRLFLFNDDCVISETYAMKHSRPQINHVGHWDEERQSLDVPKPNIWDRRKNLHGMELEEIHPSDQRNTKVKKYVNSHIFSRLIRFHIVKHFAF